MKKKMNIAVIGLGNIGSYFYNYLRMNKNNLFNKTNTIPIIRYVSARSLAKKRDFKISKKLWLKNCFLAPKIKEVDIIVELIGGAEGAAKKLVFEALKNKKHVVTANKALVAKYGDQLSRIAEKNKVNFEFEAAVCGGIPIVRSIKEGLIANNINKIYGILNGTSNYILSSMDKNKLEYNDALLKAKELGYAESNPASDINGEDVASKLKILTALAFNSFIDNKSILVEGIKNIDQIDINNANQLGYKIKLIGVAESEQNKIIQRVHPALVKENSYIAKIDGVLNAVIVESNPVGKTVLQGEGAGPGPTTSSLVSDLCSILRGNVKFPFVLPNKKRKFATFVNINNKKFSVYLRLDVKDIHGILSDITKIMAKNKVSVKRLIQNPTINKKNASIIIITHEAKSSSFVKVLSTLRMKKYIVNSPKIIRIEKI
jgi:homoserine dehydrogenase|tara:strand:+ start:1246 stop:2538 length:1293 start_codon:yes stop_codon:yes gene_type:complete